MNEVIKGKAAVIHWDLDVVFISREQRNLFIKWLSENEIDFDFEVENTLGDSLTPDVFIVSVKDMSWGNNLKNVGKFLKSIDYKENYD